MPGQRSLTHLERGVVAWTWPRAAPGLVQYQASRLALADEQTSRLAYCLGRGAWGVRREGTGREGVSAVGRGEGRGIGVSGGRGEG